MLDARPRDGERGRDAGGDGEGRGRRRAIGKKAGSGPGRGRGGSGRTRGGEAGAGGGRGGEGGAGGEGGGRGGGGGGEGGGGEGRGRAGWGLLEAFDGFGGSLADLREQVVDRGELGRHLAVDVHPRHRGPDHGVHRLQGDARLGHVRPQVDPLGGTADLHGQAGPDVADHVAQLADRGPAHRDVVFLLARGRDGVHAGRVGEQIGRASCRERV